MCMLVHQHSCVLYPSPPLLHHHPYTQPSPLHITFPTHHHHHYTRDKKDKKGADKSNGADKEDKPTDKEDGVAEDDDDVEQQEDEGEEDDDVEWLADTSEEAMRQRAAEQLTAATAAMVHAPTVAAEGGANGAPSADAGLAADAQRKLAVQQQAEEEEEESSEEEEEDLVEELRSAAKSLSPEKVASALARIDIEGGPIGRMKLLYEALFAGPGNAGLAEVVVKHKELLKLHAGNAMEQLAQLLAMEYLLVTVLPDRSKEVGCCCCCGLLMMCGGLVI